MVRLPFSTPTEKILRVDKPDIRLQFRNPVTGTAIRTTINLDLLYSSYRYEDHQTIEEFMTHRSSIFGEEVNATELLGVACTFCNSGDVVFTKEPLLIDNPIIGFYEKTVCVCEDCAKEFDEYLREFISTERPQLGVVMDI